MNKTCPRHMVILCTDSNGHLGGCEGKDERNTTQNHALGKIIGPYAREESPVGGNGKQLQRIRKIHQMIPNDDMKAAENC